MELELERLVEDFLAFRKFDFERNVIIRSRNEKQIKFSYLIHGSSTEKNTDLGIKIGVIVKDHKRSCGYNVILEAERLQEATGLGKVMVIANQFSSTARELAKRLEILTLTNGELVSIREMYKPQFSFDP
ncbi:MAG: restriction endonuclease [Candidatus Hodarchaeales archaeon]